MSNRYIVSFISILDRTIKKTVEATNLSTAVAIAAAYAYSSRKHDTYNYMTVTNAHNTSTPVIDGDGHALIILSELENSVSEDIQNKNRQGSKQI